MPNASKFNKSSKIYTPYGGKRFDGLSKPKRTLRKSLKSNEGSQGSEERSSESGSREDESMDTDSNSTGPRLSMFKPGELLDIRSRSGSMGSQRSRGSRGSAGSKSSKGSRGSRSSFRKSSLLNTNSNNNVDPDFDPSCPVPPEFCRTDSNQSDNVFLPDTPRSYQSEDTPRSYLSEDTDCSTLLGTQLVDDELFCAEIATASSPTAEEINQRLQALDLRLACQETTSDLAEGNQTFGVNDSSKYPGDSPDYPGDIATINRTLYKGPSEDREYEGTNMPKPSSLYDNLDKVGLDPSNESALLVELASKLRQGTPDGSDQSGSSGEV